jgi:hypothetical protein
MRFNGTAFSNHTLVGEIIELLNYGTQKVLKPRATVRFHSFQLKTRLSASGPISVIPERRSE